MKLVYTHPNIIVVGQARSSIELAGIECIVRNEYAAGAIGELAPIDAWPELWVVSDSDFERATQLIEQSHAQVKEPDWKCERCGASHDFKTHYVMTVHHLDMNKSNCALWNLAALCQRCHLSVQGRVDFEQGYMLDHSDWMRPHVEGFLKAREADDA